MLGPIFMREFQTVPRRGAHYLARSASLGLLWVIGVTAWQAAVGWHRTALLGETARFGLMLFQIFTYVLLTLLLFFAALSAASTVSQEKDRRTFILLLLTDMRDYEIVLGKLLGSLLPIGLLLLGSTPVLALLLLLGGIAPEQVVQAVLILAATAFGSGSLGGLVALWRDRTFQSLALSVLFLVLYLCVARGVALLPFVRPDAAPTVEAWLDPFMALQSVLEVSSRHSALHPAYGYFIVMVGLSVLLNVVGIWRLRKWNPRGEPIMQRERAEDDDKDRAKAHAAPGTIRRVWQNPILWREVRTLAYGRRPLLIKLAYFLVLSLICYFTLSRAIHPSTSGRQPFAAAVGIVPVAILSMLLVSAQAVTAITSERDGGALDLLLVTDLTPKEFIFGKLLGITWNVKEFLLPPLILAGVYALRLELLATPPRDQPELSLSMNVEALLCALGALLVLLAFVGVLGLHVALRTAASRVAIVNALGTVFFLSAGTLVSIYLILISSGFGYQWASFILFIATGVAGLWWVLSGTRPSGALTLAAWICPIAMYYCVTNIVVAKPGSIESTDPLLPFLVVLGAFGFTIAAMLVPLLSEFDVALGRTAAREE